jgi:hypothetical protein
MQAKKLKIPWRHATLIAIVVILAGVSIFQLGVLFTDFISPRLKAAWFDRSLSMWERSALYLEGEEFAGFVQFIRDHSPEDARVILPPRTSFTPYANVSLMQFYLFPRDIHNCGADEVEDCIQRVQGADWYILRVEKFPPMEIASQTMQQSIFNSKLGLFIPDPPTD